MGVATERPLEATRDRLGARRGVLGVGLAAATVVLTLFAFGAVMLATLIAWPYVVGGLLVLATVPVRLMRLARPLPVLLVPLIGLATTVISLFGLLAFDVGWASVGLPTPSPGLGLLIAGVVIGATAYAYLRWLGKPVPRHPPRWGALAGAAALVLYVATNGAPNAGVVVTALAVGVAVWGYLRAVAPVGVAHPLGWALLLVTAAVFVAPLVYTAIAGARLDLVVLLGAVLAAAVVALYVGGLSRHGMAHRRGVWVAAVVLGVVAPVVVWVAVRGLEGAGGAGGAPVGTPLPAAAHVAVPQAAIDHRPLLLFDRDEPFDRPLDVDGLLATGLVELCPGGEGLLADCRTVNGAGDLRNGFGNLRFDTKAVAGADVATRVYVHAVTRPGQGRTYLDYWWYLPDNPARSARGAMCGAGLVIPEITCFDHQSDWEGVTVVLDTGSGEPVGVHYAAHDRVVDVPWEMLQAAWRAPRYARWRSAAADHPLVFVARGTHAAYPVACDEPPCAAKGTLFDDNAHDGGSAWTGNTDCAGPCVAVLPTRGPAAPPASWNGFDGTWGSAVCLAGVYCSRSPAPRAPGQQGRYRRPWCFTFRARALAPSLAIVRAAPPAACPGAAAPAPTR